jgi:Methyltransferase domain
MIALHPRLQQYRDQGWPKVDGWVFAGVFEMVHIAHQTQVALLGATPPGGALEIGVHHGRFFLLLNQLIEGNQRSFALDVFDQQVLNIDGSGRGDLQRFQANLQAFDHHQGRNTTILAADSTTFDFAPLAQSIRLMSIDGGHSVAHTLSDLRAAEKVLTPLGVVWVDDIMHPEWPGVFEGVLRYLDTRPTLVPIAMGHNKLVLARLSVAQHFHAAYAQSGLPLKWVSLAGHALLAAPPIDLRPTASP